MKIIDTDDVDNIIISHLNAIEELKSINEEVVKQRKLIELEMIEKGNQGKLWQNGWCKAWPDYEKAITRQSQLREFYGV